MKTVIFALSFMLCTFMVSAQPFQVRKNGITLTYDKAHGTYSLSKDQVAYIQQASAYLALANGQKISTDKLTGPRSVTEKPIQDNLGKGMQYTISVKTQQGITLLQRFYFYDGIDGVILELEVKGKNLASNELVPVWSNASVGGLENPCISWRFLLITIPLFPMRIMLWR